MSILDILIGKPLANWDERAEQIGPSAGIPIFGLDALSSAAYGPEAALTLLLPLGAAGVAYIVPVSASIIILLSIVYMSYRQTIAAYPGGGGIQAGNYRRYCVPYGRMLPSSGHQRRAIDSRREPDKGVRNRQQPCLVLFAAPKLLAATRPHSVRRWSR